MSVSTPEGMREASCERCARPHWQCACALIPRLSSQWKLVVLQHPQEAREPLSTGRLLSLSFPGAIHKVGLSWRSLGAVLGDSDARPSDWGVFYLGSLKESSRSSTGPVEVTSKKTQVSPQALKGLIILDGSWKQAKTMWWRNPWLLRLARITLSPENLSMYGNLRRQPRRQCLSSMESVAFFLNQMGENSQSEALLHLFQTVLLNASKSTTETPKSAAATAPASE